jgi:Lipase
LQKENCNFIGVDWSIVAAGDMGYEYVARNNVPVAGTVLGALVDFLVDQGADVMSFHLMRFSMGAHVVGVAGWAVTRGKISRISGN